MEDKTQLELEALDCAVCLQKCHHPTQLPCGHIFCFLCVKGVAIQNKKCAMCRMEIPPDFLDHPVLLEKLTNAHTTDNFQWYYEGRNGWWKYDERSNSELEAAWNSSATECVLLLAGALYCIDFQSMMQTRRSDHTRRRHVKRDTPTLPAKGIAGIKIIASQENVASKNPHVQSSPSEDIGNNTVSENEATLSEENHENDELVNSMRTISLEETNDDSTQSIDSQGT